MERSNSMAREKRGLDSTSAEDGQPDRKRPALARSLSLSLSSFKIWNHLFYLIQILLHALLNWFSFEAEMLNLSLVFFGLNFQLWIVCLLLWL